MTEEVVAMVLLDVLPNHEPTEIVMPLPSMKRVCERARSEWGPRAIMHKGDSYTLVLQWLRSTRGAMRAEAPVSGFRIRWAWPSAHQAAIDCVGWDPRQGSSPDEVRYLINTLAGWPAATLAAGAAYSYAAAAAY
jgi:hypothetical protein